MAMRNGVVADTLRNAGISYPVIFGLQLPQISQIAREIGKNRQLAEALWQDVNVRESRLLAPALMNVEEVTFADAMKMIDELKTREEADILIFRLLRFHPEIIQIHSAVREIASGRVSSDLSHYTLTAIERFLD